MGARKRVKIGKEGVGSLNRLETGGLCELSFGLVERFPQLRGQGHETLDLAQQRVRDPASRG